MGITQKSVDRLIRHGLLKPCTMLQLGCQNLYDNTHYGKVAHDYFTERGFDIDTWDITGCQGSDVVDLRERIAVTKQYDVITDFGTLEHVSGGFYTAHYNIHNLCKVGGIIVHENPKTGHWPGHGCNYVTLSFYERLAALMGYEIKELMEEFAMGNTTDGGNISVVLRKLVDSPFISEETFNTLEYYDK